MIEQYTHAVHIRASIHRATSMLLRSSIVRRAKPTTCLSETFIQKQLREAEIRYFDGPVSTDQKIGRFDVTVHDAQRMRCLQRRTGLQADLDHSCLIHVSAPYARGQITTFDILHSQVQMFSPRLTVLKHTNDMWMIYPRQNSRFLAETACRVFIT